LHIASCTAQIGWTARLE